MSRTSREFTIEDALHLTLGGKLIFDKEIGNIGNRKILSPLRVDKHNPSFGVFNYKGIWLYKDHANEESGNAIQFLQKLYKLDLKSTLLKIKEEYKGNVVTKEYTQIYPQKETIIEFTDKPFTKEGHKYWNSFCLNEDFLRKDDIYQVKIYAINGKVVKIPDYQQVFCYYSALLDKCKLLTIGDKVEKKWITNIKQSYLWFYEQYKEPVEDLFVVKSVKDREVLSMLGYKGIALQSESATTFLKSNVEKVKKICENPIIAMGTDTQGFQTSVSITKATGFRWWNSKKYMLSFGVNDAASLCQEFSLEILDKHIKQDLKKWKNE